MYLIIFKLMESYMKKLISLLLLLIFTVGLFGCTQNSVDSGKLQIVTVNFPGYDFARQLSGEKAEVTMLIPAGAETHSFEPTTSDIVKISQCDIFIYTGGESDTWIDSLIKSADNPNMEIISLIDCVEAKAHEDEHSHSEIDEHVWTSPKNAIKICNKISSVLVSKDSKNQSYYGNKLDSYIDKLEALHKEFREVIDGGVRKTLVFGDRFPLLYFAEEYSLNYHAAFSGCSEDTEPSAGTVAELIETVKKENIPVIFKIELSADSIAKTIAEETGAEVLTFYSCHNVSKEDFDKGETYLSLMNKNVDSLKIALY